jgi:PAS domain S-box-containing protein
VSLPSGETRPQARATTREPLHASEERFRLLVESVKEYAIFMLSPTGVVQTWNAGAERIKGYRADEIIGQHFSKFYREEDLPKCARELEVAMREGRVEDDGWRVRKDGSVFWANVVITCLRDPSGELVGFAKVTRDMTERRRAEEALRQSEERFRLLVESVQDYAIFMLDPRGVVATWNVGAQRMKGYRSDEIIGSHFSRFYPADDVAAGKCEMELDVAAREGRVEDEGWRVRKDGSRFWANVVITALRNPSGDLVGFTKVTRDMTERRRAEEERLRLGQIARDRIRVLADLSETFASASSVDDVGRAVTDDGRRFAQADTCTLYLLNERTMALVLVAQRGCKPALVERIREITPESGNPVYPVGIGKADAVWIETADEYESFFPSLARMDVEGPRARAFWCVPLVAEGRAMGMIGVGFHEERRFGQDEREFVRTFARQCAQALARARRLEAERAARALAERLRASLSTTLRSIADAVIATDGEGRITLMNGVAESLTGWREPEACGRVLSDVFRIVDGKTRELVPSPVARVLETGGIVGLANHTVLLARDGREIPIDDSGAPIRASEGAIEGVVLVFRDVGDRKRDESRRALLADATAALAETLDYELTVAKVAQLAVPGLADWCAVDLVVKGERLPKRLAVAHVDPTKVMLAKELDAKYPPRPDAPTGVPQVLRTGRAELYAQIPDELLVAGCVDAEHLRIARELRLRSAMVVPLVARDRVLGAMSFVFAESGRGYTEEDLRFAEELARRCANAIENARLYSSEHEARRAADVANGAKDEFLAIVSHELRTPLNAITGWAKLLIARDFDERGRRAAIETIERNAVAMAQLIDDLLDMSRVVSGKMRIEVQRVDLPAAIDAAIESVKPAAMAKGVDVVPVLDKTAPPVLGDPARLQQVVWNLLSNAVKFASKGGRVDVLLRRVASSLEIVVADTGKGIAPSFLPNVFDAFRQEDASSSRARGGLGLGLAITRQLVELHGGRVTAHSDGEGRGAMFTVSLPISAVTPSREPAKGAARPSGVGGSFERPAQLRGLRVLVVDDDDDARRLVAAILEDCGSLVTTASSVHDAMRRLAEDVPDVLLSDIGMPESDGYDLIRRVRALPRERGGDVPAAALTAYARPEDRRRMLNSGYSIHLPKPVEPEELIAVVATLSRFIRARTDR